MEVDHILFNFFPPGQGGWLIEPEQIMWMVNMLQICVCLHLGKCVWAEGSDPKPLPGDSGGLSLQRAAGTWDACQPAHEGGNPVYVDRWLTPLPGAWTRGHHPGRSKSWTSAWSRHLASHLLVENPAKLKRGFRIVDSIHCLLWFLLCHVFLWANNGHVFHWHYL